MAKTSRLLLKCSRAIKWLLLLYSHMLFYTVSSILLTSNIHLGISLIWMFFQYQLSIFLIGSIHPSFDSLVKDQCPICRLHFSKRFHHCFFVDRCIAPCNVHFFLSFTFYATVSTMICFFLFLDEYFSRTTIGYSCLLPFGELICHDLTWTQIGQISLTRSAIISAASAGFMGFYVAKEFYIDQYQSRRSFFSETIKIIFPIFSLFGK